MITICLKFKVIALWNYEKWAQNLLVRNVQNRELLLLKLNGDEIQSSAIKGALGYNSISDAILRFVISYHVWHERSVVEVNLILTIQLQIYQRGIEINGNHNLFRFLSMWDRHWKFDMANMSKTAETWSEPTFWSFLNKQIRYIYWGVINDRREVS